MKPEPIEPNDQAFPISFSCEEYYEGLTKREYFASQIFQITYNRPDTLDERARKAVKAAEALINALNEIPEVIEEESLCQYINPKD